MVLLAYFWMFLPSFCSRLGVLSVVLGFVFCPCLPSRSVLGSIRMFLLPFSFLLFFGTLLLLLIVVVVSFVDLQKGSWTA